MRCSVRESQILQPAMFTSTPISKRRRASAFNFFENSPIPKLCPDLLAVPEQLIKYQNKTRQPVSIFKVLGTKKIRLINEKRESSCRKSALSYPPMIVISDSEEEDKTDIYTEVTLPSDLNPSSRSVKMKLEQQKENIKRNRNTIKSLKENSLETEKKKSQKRISRVDAIIDEIMKERTSTVLSPSPMVRLKSECSVDAIVEEVTGKLQDIGNIDKFNNIRRTSKRVQSNMMLKDDKKESNIQFKNDNELQVKEEQKPGALKLNNCINFENKEIAKKSFNLEDINHHKNDSSTSKMYSGADLFKEHLPVFYNQEEISDNEWTQVNGQKGVFVKKNFHMLNISNGFLKIEAKCFLHLHSARSQIFSVAEGRGIFVYDNVSGNMKVKVVPGQTVTIPSGFSCKIINSGLKKDLIFSFVKVYSE